jgi:tRNA U34 5-carboxymethylaminomethyl modifying GTPase MnmE/TrmE
MDPIGEPLGVARGRLLRLGAELQKHVDEYTVPVLQEAQAQLRQASCRIAVIGQIRAGKSSFINALVGRPGFLPSDVNPSTVVVTLLNFRPGATPPEHTGVFHFFSADEWSDLAEGGGDLRKLTERLVPGFRPELLRAQLQFMRKRAERRLGADFHALLGQSHSFKELTPEILADYIGAGGDVELGAGERRFSDITRSAELFISDGPFSYPVTLIDTPGSNDPFLVRDEITRRALDKPDVSVFVLSALQPLSAADISMLRLLNCLHKDRIIVFINRADQLADPVADGAAVRSVVERRLRLEFPAIDIPVIVGSARWASLSLLAPHVDLREHLGPAHAAPLAERERLGASTSDRFAGIDQARLSQALYESSGLPQVAAAIAKAMASSNPAALLHQIAACFLQIAKSTGMLARAEAKSIEKVQAAHRAEASLLDARLADEQEALRQFEERASALRATFRQIETHFGELIEAGTGALRNDLQRLVQEFSSQQAEVVLLSQGRRNPRRKRGCNVMPLRERLETAYLTSFGQIAGDLARIESFLYPQLRVIVANLVPDHSASFLEQPTGPVQPLPLAPLAATLPTHLGERWWRLLFAAKATPQQQAEHLRTLIDTEFAAVVEELVRLARIRLAERADYTFQRLKTIADGLVSGIERRKALLATQYRLLNDNDDEQSFQRVDSELSRRLQACAETSAACAALGEEVVAGVIAVLNAAAEGTEALQGIAQATDA